MKNFLYILCSLFIISCGVLKEQKSLASNEPINMLLGVLKNPNDVTKAKEIINNSGIHWEKLIYDKKALKIGLIKVPKEKKDFWLERLSTGLFKEVKPYSKETLNKIIEQEENILFSIRKTPCRECQSYELIINKDRKATFINKQQRSENKLQHFQLSKQEFEILKEKLTVKDFSKYEKIYTNTRIADLSSTFIIYNGNQVIIRIWKNVPKELITIHQYVEELLLDKKLIE